MGLTVNTSTLLLEGWPIPLVEAVVEMKRATYGQAVVPAKARKLLKQHVDTLEGRTDFLEYIPLRYPSWNHFRAASKAIDLKAQSYLDTCISQLLLNLPEWSGSQKSSTKKNAIYCDLCWRYPVSNRNFCTHHDPQINQLNYRLARRMLYKEGYEPKQLSKENRKRYTSVYVDYIKDIRHADQHGANQDWDKVIVGEIRLDSWMRNYRPLVVNMLSSLFDENNEVTIDQVLSALDAPGFANESDQITTPREELHNEIVQSITQLSGILTRAEAWLAIEQLYRKEHAKGRPKKDLST